MANFITTPLKPHTVFYENYKMLSVLGKGAYGTVTHVNIWNLIKTVAVKVVNRFAML